jgi:hypothetical protein
VPALLQFALLAQALISIGNRTVSCEVSSFERSDDSAVIQGPDACYRFLRDHGEESRPGGLVRSPGRPVVTACGAGGRGRAAAGRSVGPQSALDEGGRAPRDQPLSPRQRPVRALVQEPGRNAAGETRFDPASCPGASGNSVTRLHFAGSVLGALGPAEGHRV